MTCSQCGAAISVWQRDLASTLCKKCRGEAQEQAIQQHNERVQTLITEDAQREREARESRSRINSRFPVLSTVSVILRVVGWLGAILGVIGIVYGIVAPMQPGHAFGLDAVAAIALGALLILAGLAVVAFSEVIGVLFAIEDNTRRCVAPPSVSHQHVAEPVT